MILSHYIKAGVRATRTLCGITEHRLINKKRQFARAMSARQKMASAKASIMSGAGKARPAQSTLVDRGIGIMVAVVVIGAVGIPVVQDVIASVNLTGTAGTIMDFVVVGLALSLFVAAISLVR